MNADVSVTNYISYVRNVLGVRTLQSSRIREALNEMPAPETCDLLFLVIKRANEASSLTGESHELLQKMIQAMRLVNRSYVLEEYEILAGGAPAIPALLQDYALRVVAPFVVVFSTKPANNGLIQNLSTQKYMETFSPVYLSQNPNAKKVAWADLQKVMKELGIS